MTAIEIRRAHDGDLPAIQSVAHESWREVYAGVIPLDVQRRALEVWYSRDSLRSAIASSAAIVLIAESDNTPVAFEQLATTSGDTWEVARLYVLPEHQRRGIGIRLLRTAFDLARARGVQRITVTVAAENGKGRAFYERNGFSRTGEWTTDLFGFPLEELMYVHSIIAPAR